MNLTSQEQQVLALLIVASADNGHDFGIVEEVKWPDRKALGGLLANLAKKDIVRIYETMWLNQQTKLVRSKGKFVERRFGGHPVTQFVLQREQDKEGWS